MNIHVLLSCAAAVAAMALAADRVALHDGQPHGDPPFLLEEGWRPLLNGKNLAGWRAENPGNNEWHTARGIRYEPVRTPKQLSATPAPGPKILNGPKGRTVNLVTEEKFGDVELYVEFMIPEGSNSGVYLHGLYEVQVFDSYGAKELKTSDGGAIYHRWINEKPVGGSAPRVNASRPPGQWQSYQIWFRAPRFDSQGRKTENARFLRVLHNGVLVQENVEVDGPTRAHMQIAEAPTNPIMLQGDHGPVAYQNIYVRPLRPIAAR